MLKKIFEKKLEKLQLCLVALQFIPHNALQPRIRQSDVIILVCDAETKLGFERRLIEAWKDFSGKSCGGKRRGHVSGKFSH